MYACNFEKFNTEKWQKQLDEAEKLLSIIANIVPGFNNEWATMNCNQQDSGVATIIEYITDLKNGS